MHMRTPDHLRGPCDSYHETFSAWKTRYVLPNARGTLKQGSNRQTTDTGVQRHAQPLPTDPIRCRQIQRGSARLVPPLVRCLLPPLTLLQMGAYLEGTAWR